MKLFVGNLSYALREQELEALFSQYGEVLSAKIINDRETGKSRGFGFVEFSEREDGERAMEELHDFEFKGRNLKINEAQERERRNDRGGKRF